MNDEEKQTDDVKVYAEKPGSIGSNENKAPSVDIDKASVEQEAAKQLEEDEQKSKSETIQKEDSSGEAG